MQAVRANSGMAAPAGWKPGDDLILTGKEQIGKYYGRPRPPHTEPGTSRATPSQRQTQTAGMERSSKGDNAMIRSRVGAHSALWNILVGGLLSYGNVSAQSAQPERTDGPSRGALLYEMQCALCHGGSGQADGPASYMLFPPARDFTRGRFKLASTDNGVPSNEDLIATLKRGMPGSAMPSWSWMPESELQALASHVRELSVAGIVDDLRFGATESEEELWKLATSRMTPGAPMDVGHAADLTSENLELGKRAFVANCAACHGEDGKGRHETLRRDEDETLNWARDFTSGILKGGASHDELARRIQVGLHGTAMPGSQLDADQRSALIAYVRTLIPEAAEDRLVQRRETIRAQRIEERILNEDSGAAWENATDVALALAPLWWREGAILQARVAAVHDGTQVAIRIRWDDPSPEAPTDLEWPLEAPPYADAAALQLSSDSNPPFFGMRHGASATNIWHWRAIHIPDAGDLMAVLRLFPHRMGEWFTEEAVSKAPLYQLAKGPITVAGETVSAAPAGMKILDQQEALPDSVLASPTWNDGTWEVIFTRSLEASSAREVAIQPEAPLAVN